MPEVSVIVPIYKTEKYLRRCLDSICAQTFRDIEIICINDGSPDNSLSILDEYAIRDTRIQIINQENKGQSAARNIGLDKAQGTYIYFVDSDDMLHPQALEVMITVAQQTQALITVSNTFIKMSQKGQMVRLESTQSIPYKIHYNTIMDMLNQKHMSSLVWNKLFHQKTLKKWRFIEGIKFEDWPFITCLFSEIPFYASVNVPVYFYNDENESTTRSPFSIKKIHDYETGIRFVYHYYQTPEKIGYWRYIQKIRIRQSVTMMLNKTYHARRHNSELVHTFLTVFRGLMADKIIVLKDLSVKSLYRLCRLYLCNKKSQVK